MAITNPDDGGITKESPFEEKLEEKIEPAASPTGESSAPPPGTGQPPGETVDMRAPLANALETLIEKTGKADLPAADKTALKELLENTRQAVTNEESDPVEEIAKLHEKTQKNDTLRQAMAKVVADDPEIAAALGLKPGETAQTPKPEATGKDTTVEDQVLLNQTNRMGQFFEQFAGNPFAMIIALAGLISGNDRLINAAEQMVAKSERQNYYDLSSRRQSSYGQGTGQELQTGVDRDYYSVQAIQRFSDIDKITVSPNENALLDMIAKYESRGDYNIAFGGRRANFTEMTIDEVLDWQKQNNPPGPGTAAAGRYQIIEETLRGLKKELSLTGNEKFDESMQDRLGVALLERRGYSQYLNGRISEERFMHNLSKEWASLPDPSKNMKSHYAGDGVNQAHAPPAEVLAAMKSTKEAHTIQLADRQEQEKTQTADSGQAEAETTAEQAKPEPETAPEKPVEMAAMSEGTSPLPGEGIIASIELQREFEVAASGRLPASDPANDAVYGAAPGVTATPPPRFA